TASGNPVKQLRYVCKPASYADTPGADSNQGCNGDTPVWSPTGQQIALLDTGTMQLALLKA
ncbi:MAG TPA: hypothetical protein VKT52_13225, partial [Ktedonobacterales bacterium]|nr:hypothetical protein [Ktedonobacterales bacterium]